MHTFIDEAGRGNPLDKKSFTCVAALTIPDSQIEEVNQWVLELEKQQGGLLKGRTLLPDMRNKILKELANFDVFVECAAIDMKTHPDSTTSEHQQKRASYIEITPVTVNPFLQKIRSAFAQKIRETSLPLYLQANLTWLLIELVLRHATIYYSQKRPEELGDFHWVIDPKQAGQVTNFENLWVELVLPYLQCKPPLMSIKGHDYSCFERFAVSDEDIELYRTDSGKKLSKEDYPIDLKKIMTENLCFPDDKDTPGLRLVDVIVNTIFRCLNGSSESINLNSLGRLFFLRDPTSCISLLTLEKTVNITKTNKELLKILQSLGAVNRPIWL